MSDLKTAAEIIAIKSQHGLTDQDIYNAAQYDLKSSKQVKAEFVKTKNEELKTADIYYSDYMTQSHMNEYAFLKYKIAQIRLDAALCRLQLSYCPKIYRKLLSSQKAWELYALKEAKREGASFEGGSMQPFLEYSVLGKLTMDRSAELESEIEKCEQHNVQDAMAT